MYLRNMLRGILRLLPLLLALWVPALSVDNQALASDLSGGILPELEGSVRYRGVEGVILEGTGGHRFIVDGNGEHIKRFQGMPILPEAEMQTFAQNLSGLKQSLDAKGIPLILMFCTDKETIYPEYFPAVITRGNEPLPIDIVTDYVRGQTGIEVFNIRNALLAAKANGYLVYDRVGVVHSLAHYNEYGAYFAYRDLMAHISWKLYLAVQPLTLDKIDRYYILPDIAPSNPSLQILEPVTFERLGEEFFAAVPSPLAAAPDTAFRNEDASLPSLLLFRDSYGGSGDYITRYLPMHFRETVLLHWSNIQLFDAYVEHFQPDIVVIEVVEREITTFYKSLLLKTQ